ncbi:DUF1501 domain-containing protein [Fimbriiglobus ruber]|uniref:DUF1501 domain-containing protein n=1 Tax=Fimbriiglobus ruber TaxID=1908690 RepID=A0A225DNU2_9BACT|nr:DUF1501 domain-containing protein [Fimbriiglobus ruber]OWK42981.1 hypothetical protein FRUB_02580 [Fimbriiglobus ruber]
MFTFWGQKQPFCDGINRRNFLSVGAFGAGLTLADVLRAKASGPDAAVPAAPIPTSAPKAAIMVYLPGGPSHIDMYDPKPDAPAEFRGEFGTIPTSLPGVRFSEYMPLQARMMDKFAVVRSLVANDEHSDSYVMTGYTEQVNRAAAQGQHPSFGAVMSKLRAGTGDIPPFVSLRGMSMGTEPGFLGVGHRPFTPDGPGRDNLRLANGVSAPRLDERKDLLAKFDTARREADATGSMKGMDAFAQRAFDMIASGTVRKALDLKQEDPRTRDRYKNVEQFLTARRLVESGVGCVTLSYGGWDTHSGNFKTLRKQLPELDRGIANLVQDLDDRGMLNDVVVVVWGEFGRTPKINMTDAGRDHWSPVMSALVAGGGLKMGQVIGSSSARGEYPKDRPYKVPHLLATLYRAMGIDPGMTFPNGSGRPMYVLDERAMVNELV